MGLRPTYMDENRLEPILRTASGRDFRGSRRSLARFGLIRQILNSGPGVRTTPRAQVPPRAIRPDWMRMPAYWACAVILFCSSSFTCSRLKLAPFCIGGKSMKVCAYWPITCCTSTKRKNNQTNSLDIRTGLAGSCAQTDQDGG